MPDNGEKGDNHPPKQMKVAGVLQIGIREDDNVVIEGQIQKKQLCLDVLAKAILFINNYEPPKIIKPSGRAWPLLRRRH